MPCFFYFYYDVIFVSPVCIKLLFFNTIILPIKRIDDLEGSLSLFALVSLEGEE